MNNIRMLHATFISYAYDRHVHDEYVLGVMEQGVQHFYHKRGNHYARPGTIFTINPDEVHAGEAALPAGYTYRAAYVSTDFLKEIFADFTRAGAERFFRAPSVTDPGLALRFARSLAMLEVPGDDLLEAQSEFIWCLRDLFSRHAAPDRAGEMDANARRAARLKEYLRARAACGVSLDDLAREAGLSKYHVLRMFKASTGLAPHAYLLQCRVERARRALDEGCSPAEAALAAGFSDQSHLTRRFKTVYGVTPGSYRRQILS